MKQEKVIAKVKELKAELLKAKGSEFNEISAELSRLSQQSGFDFSNIDADDELEIESIKAKLKSKKKKAKSSKNPSAPTGTKSANPAPEKNGVIGKVKSFFGF